MTPPANSQMNSFKFILKGVYANSQIQSLAYGGIWRDDPGPRACMNPKHAGYFGPMSDCDDPDCIVAHVIEE